MTGGGFGGCAVALVEAARAEEAGRALHDAYRAATGIPEGTGADEIRAAAERDPRCRPEGHTT